MANKDAFRNYDSKLPEEEISEIEQDQNLKQNMMIHIEGEDNINMEDDSINNEDLIRDA